MFLCFGRCLRARRWERGGATVFFEKKNFGLLRYFFNVLVVFLGWNLLDAPSRIVFFRFEFYFLVLFSLWSTLFEAMVDLLFFKFSTSEKWFWWQVGSSICLFSFLDVGFFHCFLPAI